MSRKFKTSQENRTNYIYYTAEGTKIVITPGGDGVTEADIEFLHAMDDADVGEQRRHDYRAKSSLDTLGDMAPDYNKHLADESTNPEQIFIDAEEEAEYLDLLDKLSKAMESLLPEQKELYKKVYVDKRTNTDIAKEEGVTEAAIRHRLKRMHDRLRKFLS